MKVTGAGVVAAQAMAIMVLAGERASARPREVPAKGTVGAVVVATDVMVAVERMAVTPLAVARAVAVAQALEVAASLAAGETISVRMERRLEAMETETEATEMEATETEAMDTAVTAGRHQAVPVSRPGEMAEANSGCAASSVPRPRSMDHVMVLAPMPC
jgi:antitoxin component of MazEF toxin-antitoxin module